MPIRLIVGPEGDVGEESFDFEVCSPSALEQEIGNTVMLLRHRLLMKTFNFTEVRNYVERYVRGCEGASWEDIAQQLSRLGYWEFEDYRE